MAETAVFPDDFYAASENGIDLADLEDKDTNDATYNHAQVHQKVGAEIRATQIKLGDKDGSTQQTPLANRVLYGDNTGTSQWAASIQLTNITLTGTLTVAGNTAFDTNTLFVDASNNRVYVGADTSAATELFQVFGTSSFSGNMAVDTSTLFVDATNNRVYIGAASSTNTDLFQVFGSIRLNTAEPSITLVESDAATDNKVWKMHASVEQFKAFIANDAEDTAANWLTVDRTGTTVNDISMSNNGSLGWTMTSTYFGAFNGRRLRSYYTDNTKNIDLYHDGTNAIATSSSGGMVLDTASAIIRGAAGEEMRIYESGNTNYSSWYHDGTRAIWASNSAPLIVNPPLAANYLAPINNNTTSIGTSGARWTEVFATNGTINTSDARKKDIIGGIDWAVDFVKGLNPVLGTWKNYTEEIVVGHDIQTDIEYGENGEVISKERTVVPITEEREFTFSRPHAWFIAQEVKALMDSLEIADFAGYVDEGIATGDEEAPKALRYEEFIPVLTAALQNALARIEALENA